MAQRVLAIVAAVAFVFVAIAIRSAIDDDGDGNDDGDAGSDTFVACGIPSACNTVVFNGSIATEGASSTLDKIEADGVGDLDVWITTSAWVEILEARHPNLVAEVRPLASSPAVIAAIPDRSPAIEATCADRRLWECLGAASGTPWAELGGAPAWGPLTVGLTDPDSATGLAVLASAAAGFFGNLDFASNDFDDGFRNWLANLVGDRAESAPVRVMVTATGSYSATGSVIAQAEAEAGARAITLLEPEPAVTATVVAVRFEDGSKFPDLTGLTEALVDSGWTALTGDTPAPTFKPGVMAALYTLWTEVSG